MLKKLFVLSWVLASLAAKADDTLSLVSPNRIMQVQFLHESSGAIKYSLLFKGKVAIKPSSLGIQIKSPEATLDKFELLSAGKRTFDETWKPVWGEVSSIRNNYNEITLNLRDLSGSGILLNIIFRAFDDGIGFRYEFPRQQKLKYFIVAEEMTGFAMAGDHKTFWIPGDYDSNEYPYSITKLSEVDNRAMVAKSTSIAVRFAPDANSVQTPLMMKSDDGLYINIHEAALLNYPAMQLRVNHETLQLTSSLVPDAYGNKAYLHAPAVTPWRTIIVSDNAPAILSSKMILNLNDPPKSNNTSWIHPMKFIGVWWEMQTGVGGWNYSDFPDSLKDGKLIPNGRHSANTANVKKYIDFAAANNIKGVLVEGWNTGWEDWFGNWKENVFDFVTPYPDFDVKEISRYAAEKGVSMIMHNETSGSATNYERQLDTAYRFMNAYGYHAVKTGYVGRIIPRGEHHDGQWMVNHYVRVAQKAWDYQVTIDVHEPVRPTGLQRTYPNWMACEAARGNEFNAFSDDGNSPEHETILPFTRLMGGPMDYTPGIFKLKGYASSSPARQLHTTLTKQLALYITMYSPVQMAADLPANYEAHMDAFQFIKDVAVDWDDTKVIQAEPGDYIVEARKAKGSNNWFLGAITDENARTFSITPDFLEKDKWYYATIYRDADNADWKTNPEAYTIEKKPFNYQRTLDLKLAPGGGTAIMFVPLTAEEQKGLAKEIQKIMKEKKKSK